MKKFIVITTINRPTEAIKKFSRWKGWELVVVGDRKTPADWYCENTTFLDVEAQHRVGRQFSMSIPNDTYVRKMVGYIYAINNGADVIFESDDDNIPYHDASITIQNILDDPCYHYGGDVDSETGWLNVYESLFSAQGVWPRGYPIEYLRTDKKFHLTSFGKPRGVIQFLADHDPDVDAIYRMVNGKCVVFGKGIVASLRKGTMCPINSQATLWFKESFPFMFLPVGIPDRQTDIIRGYMATIALWRMKKSVYFASPIVFQERNEHNLLDDFVQEVELYKHADKWCKGMYRRNYPLTATAEEIFMSCMEYLVRCRAIPSINKGYYKSFIKEIRRKI